MGVVVVPDAAAAELSRRLREHLPAGLRRWHWRDERRGSHRRFLSLMADFDRKDRREVLGAQQAGVAPKGLVYRHGRPRDEPLLWLPDALVGAVGVAAALGEHEYRYLLPEAWQRLRWLPVP